MGQVENLQEELLKSKKTHAFAAREASLLRTRVRILEKECKKKDREIDELLRNDQFVSKSEQRIEVNSLKRKVLLFERALREKTEEVAKLINDREVSKAVDSRKQIEKLKSECSRLRKHLSESVPEFEFFREKQQYMEVINQLTEENIAMRKIIGDLEVQGREHGQQNIIDERVLVHQLRDVALAKKQDAETYKNALHSLVKRKLNRVENRTSSWNDKVKSRTRVSRRRMSGSPASAAESNFKRKKFPLRIQPTASKLNTLRSKSIEAPVQQTQGRLSRQFSDNRIERHCDDDCADFEESEIGKEFLMPVYRKTRNVLMYRHALDSDSSTQSSQASNNYLQNHSQRVSPSLQTGETEVESEEDGLPTKVFDAQENVYAIYADLGHENDDELAEDDEARRLLMKLPLSDVESWLEANSVDSEMEEEMSVHAFVEALSCHLKRSNMLEVRKEEDEI